jgi:AcrR family transcriptional regulator
MESGFRLFSEKGIETVKMADIVEDCGVSRQSLYRYFSNKTDLVIAIGAWQWEKYITHYTAQLPAERFDKLTAAERMKLYLDSFIDLYRSHRDVLRYNYYFNSFLANERVSQEQSRSYQDVVDTLKKAFHELYLTGMKDGTLRTDLPESVMFSSSFHIMLAAVTRYAMGLVYLEADVDPERELVLLEEALFKVYAVEQKQHD